MFRLLLRRLAPLRVPRAARCVAISTSGEHVSQKIDRLSDREYSKIALDYLESLSDQIEQLAETHPEIDLELSHGVLTVTVAPGKTYVINKQPPNKQIWLSSPVSGPKRYDLIGGKWVTLRDHTLLLQLMQAELSAQFGKVDLELPH